MTAQAQDSNASRLRGDHPSSTAAVPPISYHLRACAAEIMGVAKRLDYKTLIAELLFAAFFIWMLWIASIVCFR